MLARRQLFGGAGILGGRIIGPVSITATCAHGGTWATRALWFMESGTKATTPWWWMHLSLETREGLNTRWTDFVVCDRQQPSTPPGGSSRAGAATRRDPSGPCRCTDEPVGCPAPAGSSRAGAGTRRENGGHTPTSLVRNTSKVSATDRGLVTRRRRRTTRPQWPVPFSPMSQRGAQPKPAHHPQAPPDDEPWVVQHPRASAPSKQNA